METFHIYTSDIDGVDIYIYRELFLKLKKDRIVKMKTDVILS